MLDRPGVIYEGDPNSTSGRVYSAYFAHGARQSWGLRNGSVVGFNYDPLQRLGGFAFYFANTGANAIWSFGYNPAGQVHVQWRDNGRACGGPPAHCRPGKATGTGRALRLGPRDRSRPGPPMFRALYDWTLRLAGHRHAIRSLAAVSFAESSFFPIPPDVMVVPMILARRDQAYLIAAVCTISSVLGGVLGYAIGYFLYDSLGLWLINLYGAHDAINELQTWYDQWGAAVILIKGLTPIPFKIVTIASGALKYNFGLFVLLATITRGARFFLIAWLLKRWGAPMQAFIEKRLTLIGWGTLALIAGGFAAVALL